MQVGQKMNCATPQQSIAAFKKKSSCKTLKQPPPLILRTEGCGPYLIALTEKISRDMVLLKPGVSSTNEQKLSNDAEEQNTRKTMQRPTK
jgi:hypothetical protein